MLKLCYRFIFIIDILEMGGPKKDRVLFECLAAEAVQGSSLTLECVHDVERCDGLALGVLCVCYCIANNIFQEDFHDASCFFVNQSRDSLYSASASQAADCRLRDALDVVAKYFAMALSTSFSQAFASFAASRHDVMNILLLSTHRIYIQYSSCYGRVRLRQN